MPLSCGIKIAKTIYNGNPIFVIIDALYLFILSICYILLVKRNKFDKNNVSNYLSLVVMINFFQIISAITRNVPSLSTNDFVISNLLALDYLVLLLMSYKLYFIKGGKNLCGMVLGFSSDLLISLKKLPIKLQQSYQSRKPKETDNELANKIYLVFFWLYNFFTVAIVLFIATLNDTFIECIFILSSFWINKGVFGKPFHLKKASTCFIVSSLSYYILNRLTFEIGISFLVPVILGISLSYITSLFVARKENIYLYRGMPIDDFYNLITKVTSNQEYINICKMYYIDKETIVKIAIMFNYSEIRIKQIKKKINDDIRELRM